MLRLANRQLHAIASRVAALLAALGVVGLTENEP